MNSMGFSPQQCPWQLSPAKCNSSLPSFEQYLVEKLKLILATLTAEKEEFQAKVAVEMEHLRHENESKKVQVLQLCEEMVELKETNQKLYSKLSQLQVQVPTLQIKVLSEKRRADLFEKQNKFLLRHLEGQGDILGLKLSLNLNQHRTPSPQLPSYRSPGYKTLVNRYRCYSPTTQRVSMPTSLQYMHKIESIRPQLYRTRPSADQRLAFCEVNCNIQKNTKPKLKQEISMLLKPCLQNTLESLPKDLMKESIMLPDSSTTLAKSHKQCKTANTLPTENNSCCYLPEGEDDIPRPSITYDERGLEPRGSMSPPCKFKKQLKKKFVPRSTHTINSLNYISKASLWMQPHPFFPGVFH